MKLQALLTVGWPDDRQSALSARLLLDSASDPQIAKSDDDNTALEQAILRHPEIVSGNCQISGLDLLFRRRTLGFNELKRFVGALSLLRPSEHCTEPLICRIDGFAWCFLAGAKNFDLLLPLNRKLSEPFFESRKRWAGDFAALEEFERRGTPLDQSCSVSAEAYLALRAIVTRPSARDERRALATLLVSGPSTLGEITTDLRLNYSLGERSLAVFEVQPLAAIERRGERFAIRQAALPLVLFCLRETMGLDLLQSLPEQAEV